MADYPCDLHLARYRGPSTRAFLNLYRDDQVVSLRVTSCQDCLQELLGPWLPRASTRTQEGHWDPLEEDQGLESLWRAQDGPAGGFRPRGR